MVLLLCVALIVIVVAVSIVSIVVYRRFRALEVKIVQNEQRSHLVARADALTTLPNRLALMERLPAMLETASANQESVAVLFVDVDRFKTINDTLGHQVGDELLRAITQRFMARLNVNASIFRPGGDEFVILVDRIRHKRTIASAAMDVLDAFTEPFAIGGRELFMSASVGASVFPKNAQTADDLIAFADSAMYRAKEAGRNKAKFYDGTMHARVLERMALEHDLRHALARRQLRLVYQPIVEIAGGRFVAAEALLRWDHPTLGELLPQAFIGIAEETGIIVEMSRWLIREACERAVQLRSSLAPDFRIAVNLSPRDFYESDFPAVLAGILRDTLLPPAALELEVTENIVLSDTAVATLRRVHETGVRIVVDDFGIGYSSLGYIKRLPVDAIKIDQTFIKDVTRDAYDQGIVKAIATLGRTLGLKVTAEGIETEAQRQFVRANNCDFAQGFFFQRPGTWEQVVQGVQEARNPKERRVIPLYGTQ